MKKMGLIPPGAERSGRSPKEKPWEALTDEERKIETRAMEIYAAMIDQVDMHTGRLIEYLKSEGSFDDTMIIFMSDNGAEGHDLDETWPWEAFPKIRKTIEEAHDFSYENMGRPGSYVLYGPNWANAGTPAFRLHKGFPTEGGKRVAAFVHFPAELPSGVIVDDLISIKDIAPTLLAISGIEHPGTEYSGRAIEPMSGTSALGILRGTERADPGRVLGDELMGKRAIRAGDWKLVHMPEPYGNGQWQLYDLSEDLAEAHDLAGRYPEKVAEMEGYWQTYARANRVILPDWVSGY